MPFSVTDVDAIFAAAIELSSPDERAEYVQRVCGESAELRQRVDELLAAHFAAGDFLEPPNATVRYRDDDVQAGPGTVIGPYKLLQQIGEGGMGVVFMAEQTEPIQRTVALKIIKPGMDTRQVIARFEAERQALAMMDHPNIARVVDAGTTDTGRPYFVMELVKGVPITKYCDEKQLTLRERLELIKPVCEAVQHAHQKGIIHRDLKPTNVLVAEYDNRAVPKVIDFGVAKATAQKLTERTMFTEFGQVIGTVEYMSPEQAKFNQLDIDTRSDIYSLGVLLYELLAGSPPFEQKRLREAAFDEVLRIIREEEPPKPSTRLSTSETLPSIAANRHTEPARLSRDVSGELDWIVMKCLEKDRSRRYESASALAADVMHYLADEPVRACPPSAGYRLKKFMRRNKVPVAAAAAILVLLVAGVTVSTWQAIRIKAEQKNTLAQKKEAERQRAVAEQKQKESEAVLGFINSDVFAGATPERMPDLKVRDEIVAKMLEPAAKVVRERFKDQPLVQAAVLHQIALSFQKLGRLMEAAPLFKEAMELRQRHLGHDNTETITAVSSYGLVLQALGRPEAEGLLKDALDRRRRILGENHAETLVALRNYANVLYSLERYEEAEPLFKEALERRRRRLGEDHLDTITSLSDYAYVLDKLVRLEEGESLHKEVLERRRRLLGENHPETLHAINGYAYVLGMMALARAQPSSDAEPLYKDALARRRSVLGDDHPDTLTSMQNYAGALKSLGRYADAEKLANEALERGRRVLGDDHPNTIKMMDRRADLLQLLARAEEALPLYREAMQRRRKIQGDSHTETLTSLANYAKLLQLLGREGEAEPFVQEEIKRQRAASTGSATRAVSRQAEETLVVMAQAFAQEGLLAEAEATWRRGLAMERELSGNDHLWVANSLMSLGQVLAEQQKWAEAEEAFAEAASIQRKKLPTTDPTFSNTLVTLASFLNKQEKGRPAESLLREALQYQQSAPQPELLAIANTRSHLGNALLMQQRYAEAEPLILSACGELSEAEPMWQPHRRTAYQCAVDLYERWGNKPQAEEWQARLQSLPATKPTTAAASGLTALDKINGLAYRARRDGRLEEARSLRLQVVKLATHRYPRGDPKLTSYQLQYIDLLFQMRRYEETETVALDVLDAAGTDKAQQVRALHTLVKLYTYWQKPQKAIASSRKAIELDPAHAMSYSNLGHALYSIGKFDEAVASYRKAIELDPKLGLAYCNLALALRTQRKFDEAVAAGRKAVELQPDNMEAHRVLRRALFDQGKADEADTVIRQAIARVPKDARLHNEFAWLLATEPAPEHGNPREAVELAQRAVELAPHDGNIRNTLGVAHYRAGAWQPAIEVLNKSMELRKGGDAVDWFFLAMANWQLDNKHEARKWFDKAVPWMDKNQPQNEELLRFRAEAAELLSITEPKPELKSAPPTEESAKADDSTTTSSPTTTE